MQDLLGEEYSAYIESMQQRSQTAIRINTAKISLEQWAEICPFKTKPVPWTEKGFLTTDEQCNPAKHPYYYAGLYYIQEPSAMIPASILPVHEGDRILDVCAAPGGKATELAAKLRGTGQLVANDISVSRAMALAKNLQIAGAVNAVVTAEKPERLQESFLQYFDGILIDAPCSGEGMFRKDKKMVKAWEEHGPEFFSNLQRNIILQAARMLKPGGLMLYSTCTFDPGENERIIEHLKKEYPEFHVLPMESYEGFCPGIPEVTEEKDEELKKTVRIFPHKMKGEGHYVALLQKGEPLPAKELKTKKKAGKIPADLEEFMKQVTWKLDGSRLDIHGERIYYMPEGLPDVRGIRFLRTGLLLGELKKNRFEPSQAFAMCLKKDEYAQIIDLPCEDERVRRYLKGETLDVDDLTERKAKGWYLVCVDGFPLGWGKVSNGTLKNKYLPGWRLC